VRAAAAETRFEGRLRLKRRKRLNHGVIALARLAALALAR
jgi:hypothetical protein